MDGNATTAEDEPPVEDFSPTERRIIWTMWTSATAISMAVLWLLVVSILFSPRARNNRFNLYLVFSLGVDAIFNTFAFGANASALYNDGINDTVCRLHGWYANFYIAANFWMIAIIAYQIHEMLRVTYDCKRYHAPNRGYIVKQGLAVYLFAGLFVSIYQAGDVEGGVIPPIILASKIVCIPIPLSHEQKMFNYLFMWALSGIIPSIYILSVASNIYWRQLLPINGKTRQIALYYMRLIVLFLIIWAVFVTLHFKGGWFAATAAFVYDLTGLISVSFALTKKDINAAFFDFLKWLVFCQKYENADDLPSNSLSRFNSPGGFSVRESEVGS